MEIKIFLRDKNEKIVNSWKSVFHNCDNIEISCGNIFDLTADAIISPANSFGFMDGGIDLVYSEYFGWELEERLQNKIREMFYGEIPIGVATIIETNNKNIKYLISAPTMRVPAIVSNTVNAYLAFRASLIEVIKFNKNNEQKLLSILCPGLGTLTGNISPKKCAIQMKYAYDSIMKNKILFPHSLHEASLEDNYLKKD
jgi:O-acetyl-ADP-ribose deacetylase (regulator of RNase III)